MKLTITYNDKTLTTARKGKATLEQETQALLTTLLHTSLSAIASAPKAHQKALRELIYDNLNIAFANILSEIIPDDETFLGSLTAEAILKAEDDLINKKYQELKSKKPKPNPKPNQ